MLRGYTHLRLGGQWIDTDNITLDIYLIQAGDKNINDFPDEEYGLKAKVAQLIEADSEYKQRASWVEKAQNLKDLQNIIFNFENITNYDGEIYLPENLKEAMIDLRDQRQGARTNALPRKYGIRKRAEQLIKENKY